MKSPTDTKESAKNWGADTAVFCTAAILQRQCLGLEQHFLHYQNPFTRNCTPEQLHTILKKLGIPTRIERKWDSRILDNCIQKLEFKHPTLPTKNYWVVTFRRKIYDPIKNNITEDFNYWKKPEIYIQYPTVECTEKLHIVQLPSELDPD